jgi:hypothetical protein
MVLSAGPAFVTAAKVVAATGDRDIRITIQHNNRPFDYARNIAAKAFLESGREWLLMVARLYRLQDARVFE